MIPIVLAIVPFFVRLLYLVRFRFRSPLGRPIKYQQAKKALDWMALVMVGGSVYALIMNGARWWTAFGLVAFCLFAEYVARFFAYNRAVNQVYSHLEFLPEGRDRLKAAAEEVDSQLARKDRM